MKWLRAETTGRQIGVDRDNKLIRGVILAEEGPFKTEGRGEFDAKAIKTIVSLAKAEKAGLKSRFTHPDVSNDGLGKFLGRVRNVVSDKLEGDVSIARGDLHLAESAFNTPSGDIGSYVLDLAEEDPDSFGMSLVLQADEEFRVNRDGTLQTDELGDVLPPLWRPTELHAVDAVDTPDATTSLLGQQLSTDGLPDDIVRKASQLLRTQFAGKDRQYVEEHLSSWLSRVLDHYWPIEEKPNQADLLRKRIALRTRAHDAIRLTE